jgi:hypothetical protein
MPIQVLALSVNFGQIFEVDVDCVIVDLVKIEAKFKKK